MSEKIKLRVNDCQGYTPDQVKGISLGELREVIEAAIIDYDEDTEIVVFAINNLYGASYGSVDLYNPISYPGSDEEEGN